jgi:hypothetical protein
MSSVILFLHVLIVLLTLWQIIKIDHNIYKWIRGEAEKLSGAVVTKYHNRIWFGLTGIILTGILLFYPMREFLLSRPQFFIKMSFVVALIGNGFVIGVLKKTATENTFASLSIKQKTVLFLSGGISTLSWIGAISMALFLIPD